MSKITWNAEMRNIKDLKPNPDNPRVLTEKGMADLKRSVDKFGLAEPLVIQPDGFVIGGHARLKDAELRQESEIMCMVPSRALTDDEQKELNVRLNRNIAGEWDWDALANQFEIEELTDWGFDEAELLDADDNNKDTIYDQSIQMEPAKEFLVILLEDNQIDEAVELLSLKMVRRGGYKKGSQFDSVGMERCIRWERIRDVISNSKQR